MNLDTRNILVREGELGLRPSSLKRGEAICDYCPLRERGCQHERVVERCGQFVPALMFVDERGLEGSFSTFRGSSIWYDRARVVFKTHKRFALVRSSGELIGFARITDAHRDGFAALMRDHAHSNHLMKDRGLTKEQAAADLTKWIRHNMGSMYVREPDALNTVIYLERVHEAPGEAEEADRHREQAPDRALHGVAREDEG